jgi:hypothetical protein
MGHQRSVDTSQGISFLERAKKERKREFLFWKELKRREREKEGIISKTDGQNAKGGGVGVQNFYKGANLVIKSSSFHCTDGRVSRQKKY